MDLSRGAYQVALCWREAIPQLPVQAVLGVSGSEPEGCEQLGCRLCWLVCSCFFRCWDAEIADIRS